MTETLAEKRQRFTHYIALLILKAEDMGYKVAVDQVKRTQAEADANAARGSGIRNSLHLSGLAADLLLYRNGVYLDTTEAHRQLGEWWEMMGDDHRWGGRFGDGNHYSIEHNGVK